MERKTRFPRVFVTVGTTRFDALVEAVVSEPSLAALEEMGAREVVVQHGNSPWSSDAGSKSSALRVSGYNFKSDIASDMLAADLVVSHAGSGSILEALRAGKPLVVVVNELLADNHQAELAEELAEQGFLVWTLPAGLARTLKDPKLRDIAVFGKPDISGFRALLDEEVYGAG